MLLSVPAWLERQNSSSPAFPVKHQLIYLTWPVCQHSQRQGKINMFTSFTEDSILRQTRGQVWINTHTLVCPLGLASEAHPKLSHHCQGELLLRQPPNGTPGCTQGHLEAHILHICRRVAQTPFLEVYQINCSGNRISHTRLFAHTHTHGKRRLRRFKRVIYCIKYAGCWPVERAAAL